MKFDWAIQKCCTITVVVWAMGSVRAGAYPSWSQNRDATNCRACHGDFQAASYISFVDGQNWGNLHNLHRGTMLSSDCDTCHGAGTFPVVLDSSAGGTGFEAIACMGCHGRNEDMGHDSVSAGRGSGLRQHHHTSGVTVCAGCHTDANPLSYTPVGEDVPPPYYFTPDAAHANKPTDPCNPNGEEDYAGSAIGLDNDGDDLYDTADADCAGVPAATVTTAVSRRANPHVRINCDVNLIPPRKSEPHQGGIQEVRIGFDVAPGGGGTGATLEQATCAAPAFVPYAGASVMSGSVVGNELILTFTPGLENARAYRINLGAAITSIAGQTVTMRGLIGDTNSDGFVNATDRSVVVSAWTGGGFSCPTDLNNDGATNATDRSVVVSAWTGGPATNCAP